MSVRNGLKGGSVRRHAESAQHLTSSKAILTQWLVNFGFIAAFLLFIIQSEKRQHPENIFCFKTEKNKRFSYFIGLWFYYLKGINQISLEEIFRVVRFAVLRQWVIVSLFNPSNKDARFISILNISIKYCWPLQAWSYVVLGKDSGENVGFPVRSFISGKNLKLFYRNG